MSDPVLRIVRAVGDSFWMVFLVLIPPVCVFIDVLILENGVSEVSLTEFTQVALLLLAALLFGGSARRHRDKRGFLVLVSAFIACMMVRELDDILDMIWHGFWTLPVTLIALTAIAYAAKFSGGTVLVPMADYIDTKSYYYLTFGLIIVLVFSRVFGSGNLFLEYIMGDDYEYRFKTALQEGLELLGYIFIAQGAGLYFWRRDDAAKGSV